MFCPECGNRIDAWDPFCVHCGAQQPVSDHTGVERVLYFFGPFGVSLCEGRYSVWKWHTKNTTTIELTNRRILGLANTRRGLAKLRSGPGAPAFEIPYDSVVAYELHRHPSPVAFQDILSIRYRDGDAVREKSIAMFRHELHEACAILERFAPPEVGRLPGRDEI